MDNPEAPPRSLHDREKCYVRFINNTNKIVEILWIDYSGRYVRYRVIKKGDYIDINTFKTHPFVAKVYNTEDRLHIGGQYFYHPKTSREVISERFPNTEIPEHHEVRVRAFITLPVYSLYYACLLVIRDKLYCVDDVDELDLPRNLKFDLKKAIRKEHVCGCYF